MEDSKRCIRVCKCNRCRHYVDNCKKELLNKGPVPPITSLKTIFLIPGKIPFYVLLYVTIAHYRAIDDINGFG